MSSNQSNNKRIAKNTLFLYIRMFVTMAVTLYTSRVILQALGVDDFGLFNVIAGVISMMGILNSAMSVATNRYLAFELGKSGEQSEVLHKTFCINFKIYIILCVVFAVLAETVGLWFVNSSLNIPAERILAANWVYQFMIVSVVAGLLVTPYNAAIIAHEQMSIYAYMSLFDVFMKLAIVYALSLTSFDRLIVYGALFSLVSCLTTFAYYIYCKIHYAECKYTSYKDPKLFRELISYTGWNLFGSGAAIARDQGLNMVLNIFFGTAVNAARGLAAQVNSAVSVFFSNFFSAVRPQITKLYASECLEEMYILVARSSRFSYYLILLLALPIFIETPNILTIWLGTVPKNTVEFARLVILTTAVDAIANPLMTVAHATGKIKLYQSAVGTITILTLPVSYVFLKLGYPPVTVFYVTFVLTVLAFIVRFYIVKRLVPGFPVRKYSLDVFALCIVVTLASALPSLAVNCIEFDNIWLTLPLCALYALFVIFAVYLFGLQKGERNYLNSFVSQKLRLWFS